MEERLPGCEALQRYREIAVMLTGRDGARAMDGIEWISETCEELKIPRLRSYAIGVEAFPDLIEAAEGSSSMQGNPIRLERGEMQEILTLAL
jgi:alcohol dehydrogenase class IV